MTSGLAIAGGIIGAVTLAGVILAYIAEVRAHKTTRTRLFELQAKHNTLETSYALQNSAVESLEDRNRRKQATVIELQRALHETRQRLVKCQDPQAVKSYLDDMLKETFE